MVVKRGVLDLERLVALMPSHSVPYSIKIWILIGRLIVLDLLHIVFENSVSVALINGHWSCVKALT